MVDLKFIHLGNGIRVYDKTNINGIGEYNYIAHISKERDVKILNSNISSELMFAISYYALTEQMTDDMGNNVFETTPNPNINIKKIK